jgi:hypothetical protein
VEYWWRYGPAASPPRSAGFSSQSEAEEWLGESWAELRAEGVDEVTLFAGEDEVYGPMSLHPAEE